MGNLSRNGPDVVVYVNGEAAQAAVMNINHHAGGRALPSATIRFLLTSPLVNQSIVGSIADVEIVRSSANQGAPNEQVLFWGQTAGLNIATGESLVIEARQAPFHFGAEPLYGMPEKGKSSVTNLPGDIVFNPLMDGVVRGNMDKRFDGPNGCHLFLDPSRVFTSTAREFATGAGEDGGTATGDFAESSRYANDVHWTLRDAVFFCCWQFNESESWIRNPRSDDLGNLDSVSALDRPLQNVRLRVGMFLNEMLDELLGPYNFSWVVDYPSRGQRKIRIFKRGEGEQRQLYLQAPQEFVNPDLTNVERAVISTGYQSLFNHIGVMGDHKLYESTFVLKPAWSSEYDTLTETELQIGTDDWNENPNRHRVYRDWVLNEAGDYNGLRSTITEPHNFATLFTEETTSGGDPNATVMPRRRKFLPCITHDFDRKPMGRGGYVVEYALVAEPATSDWKPIEELANHSFEVLHSECGIRFTGIHPPRELMEVAITSVKIRITASVYADDRIFQTAEGTASLQSVPAWKLIDAQDKFKFRYIASTSKFRTQVDGGELQSSAVDDTLRAQRLAARLQDAYNCADVSATVTIPWLDADDYQIGQIITGIVGRSIDLGAGHPSGTRYPQIVGISYDCQRHKKTLALETFRDARFV